MRRSYGTLSETIIGLKRVGYTVDFNVKEQCVACHEPGALLSADDFQIDKFYRFEGASNPENQSMLYAISSTKFKMKGFLVNGYGVSADESTDVQIALLGTHPELDLVKNEPENN